MERMADSASFPIFNCRQAFPGHVIDDVQDTEPPAAGELVMDKIERPAGIRPGLHENRRSCTYGAASSAPLALKTPIRVSRPTAPVSLLNLLDTIASDA